jgi:hypothetical protein
MHVLFKETQPTYFLFFDIRAKVVKRIPGAVLLTSDKKRKKES